MGNEYEYDEGTEVGDDPYVEVVGDDVEEED